MARHLARTMEAPMACTMDVRHSARPMEGLKVGQMARNLAHLMVRHLARPLRARQMARHSAHLMTRHSA
eukprot:scaffold10658_cov728-Chaetoceros_neogracile.AAC.1